MWRRHVDRRPRHHVFLTRGLTHTFRSVDGAAEILFIVTPGYLDEFFELRGQATSPAEISELVRRFL